MTPTPWHILAAVVGGLAACGATATRGWRAGRWPVWVVLVAAGSFVVNAVVAADRGLPQPRVHDEFSYLLAADTFARGRLANPTPPAWAALQTFHVLVRPTYASKYPPGQGLALALGRVATGLPIAGAWLATAALVAAAGWAVGGFAPGPWAVGAAVLVAGHPQVLEWSQTYWGGSVAAAGGAMVLGGWVRLARREVPWRWRDAAMVGLGLGVLALSRPYEGLAATAPLLAHLLARRPRAVAAAALWIAPVMAFSGYYNFRVTGRPWRLPYLTYERQYAAAPPLLVGRERPVPTGVPASMRAYAEDVELPHCRGQRSLTGFAAGVREKAVNLAGATLPSPWLWPLAVLVPWAVAADRRLWGPVAMAAGAGAATLVSNWTRTQYVAPATAAVVVLAVGAARRLPPRAGRAAWAGAVVGTAVLPFGPVPAGPRFQRADLLASLNGEAGRQLVLVHYLSGHRPDDEWVYNDADPPSSQVVWARDDGGVSAEQVRAAYPGRTVWHLDVDAAAAAVRRE